jgi:ADP-ribose pyrophosphatase
VSHDYVVVSSVERFANPVFRLISDEVVMPGGGVVTRDYLRHVGVVAVVALNDRGEVLLIEQYRHPVGRRMWELPAGLTDVPGEALVEAARRELAEEADLRAERWHALIDLHTTPGCSDEAMRVFLALELSPVPDGERHQRTDEEAELVYRWVDLDEAVGEALSGKITNGPCVAGLLAAARARDNGWQAIREVGLST